MTVSHDPVAWFISQFISFIMRPNEKLANFLKTHTLSKPEAAIQVRRTDKQLEEAKKHEVQEYMERVDEYYHILDEKLGHNVERRLFIATDELDVVKEVKEKHSHYTVQDMSKNANECIMIC